MQAETVELSGDALHGVHDGSPASTRMLATLPQQVRLGRLEPKSRPQALAFTYYFNEAAMAVAPPTETNRYAKAADAIARMYRNDVRGCCVISSSAHMLGLWSANDSDSGGTVLATDLEIENQYVNVCGPGDQGCYIAAVMDYMRDHGFQAGGKLYRIDGYVSVDWRNTVQVKVATVLFGAINIGVNLPKEWTQKAVWDVTNSPKVGGHCIPVIDYNETGPLVSSWGRKYQMTWAAFSSSRWVTEAYCALAQLWYGDDKLSPAGVDVKQLKADLEKVGGGHIPPLPDPTPEPSGSEIVTLVGLDVAGKEVRRFVAKPAEPFQPPDNWR